MIRLLATIVAAIGAINWGLSTYKASEGGMNIIHQKFGDKDAAGTLVQDTPANWNDKEKKIYMVVAVCGLIAIFLTLGGKK
jgi:uncharacterized membrane protein YuzA (DUF378 family)